MTRIITLRISGRGVDTDAPTVEDALDQMRDYVAILRGVEEAVSGELTSALDWRIVRASRSSPLEFAIQAFPRKYATNIDRRVECVAIEAAMGLAILQTRAERPPHFTNKVIEKTHQIFERASHGINLFEVDFGVGLPSLRVTPSVGRVTVRNIGAILNPPINPHQEIGSIEGYFQGVERGGYNRRVAYVNECITGEPVRCIVSDSAARELECIEIREIWKHRRVEVHGRMYFAEGGKLERLYADGFRFLRPKSNLPQIDDVIDPDFTGGIAAEEYLERLRDGTLS